MLEQELGVMMVTMDQLPGLEDGDWGHDDEVYAGYSRLRLRALVPVTKKVSVGNRYYVKVSGGARITYIASFPALAIVQQHPIVDTIVLLPDILENFGEQLPKEVVVRRLLESQFSHVVHVNGKLLCKE